MIFMWAMVFIVKWCSLSINDIGPNHMCEFIYGSCVYSYIVVIKGGSVYLCFCFLVGRYGQG